jgi:hypothetical protein
MKEEMHRPGGTDDIPQGEKKHRRRDGRLSANKRCKRMDGLHGEPGRSLEDRGCLGMWLTIGGRQRTWRDPPRSDAVARARMGTRRTPFSMAGFAKFFF